MDNKKNTISISNNFLIGSISLAIGFYMANKLYNKIEGINWKNIFFESPELSLAKEARRKGYTILISTMIEYNKKFPKGNFKNFMENMWEQDYKIILKNESGDSSCKRDYSEWEKLYNEVKKRMK